MDNFSERKKKELFEKVSEKQLKYAKKTMLLIFVLIGAVFLIMGLVLIACNVRDEENGVLVGIIFAPIGAFFMILGLTLRFAVPRTYNYENYKKRMEKYGYYAKGRVYLLHMGNARALRGGNTAISAEAEGCFLCRGYGSAVCASVYLLRS